MQLKGYFSEGMFVTKKKEAPNLNAGFNRLFHQQQRVVILLKSV